MIWFTSDHHFLHDRVAGYCGRPKEHECLMLYGLKDIQSTDHVYFLGDILFRLRRPRAHSALNTIVPPASKKIFVEGNHDRGTKARTWHGWDERVKYKRHLIHEIDRITVAMSHRPQDLREVDAQIYIHGHLHDIGPKWRWEGDKLWVNVCVEQWDYKPVPWDNIRSVWQLNTPTPVEGQDEESPEQQHEKRRKTR